LKDKEQLSTARQYAERATRLMQENNYQGALGAMSQLVNICSDSPVHQSIYLELLVRTHQMKQALEVSKTLMNNN